MELATPITIFWDLPADRTDTGFLLRICAEIMACHPLMLHLSEPGPGIGEGTAAVLDRLKSAPVAVSLTIPPSAHNGAARAFLYDQGLKEILLAVEHLEDLSTLLHGGIRGKNGAKPGAVQPTLGISFTVTLENWRELPALVALCREQGIPRLVLPMQRLYNDEPPFFLNREKQRHLYELLTAAGGLDGLDLTIHDPFLWRASYPGLPFPQGGCQAANTMLAVAPDGSVYPCPALPVLLGRIGEAALKEIVALTTKKEFRCLLLENPEGCRDCRELVDCRGGCRGRSYVVHGSLDGTDPACD